MKAGPVIADLKGLSVDASEHDLLKHPNLGGIILFSRNFESPHQLQALCKDIRDVSGKDLLITVDQEGGRVQRFREGFTRLPPAGIFGRLYDEDPDTAVRCARETGMTMAFELRRCGVDLSFAPVADVDHGVCAVIGDRSFHNDPKVVSQLCESWCEGMREAGMKSVAKHFPGHGAVHEDSHLETPMDRRTLEDLETQDILPFAYLIERGLEAVMTAHVCYPGIDKNVPTFSSFWLSEVLRNQLGFEGVVFSDDLTMAGAAVAGTPVERAQAAIRAGCDVVLVCNDPAAALNVLADLEVTSVARSPDRLKAEIMAPSLEALEDRVAEFGPELSAISAHMMG